KRQQGCPFSFAEFNADASLLVTCGADDQLTVCDAQVWKVASGEPVGRPLPHRDGVRWASFSPDGRRLVTACEDFTAIVWDVATGRPLKPDLLHGDQVRTANFSSDNRWVVTASADKTAQVWNAETGDRLT